MRRLNYFCKQKVYGILQWFTAQFPFYTYYKMKECGTSNCVTQYVPCIDAEHLEYLIYHNKWVEIASKLNMKIKTKKTEDELCQICLENTQNILTQCNHEYCFQCIYEWLEKQTTCPNCRKHLKLSEMSIMIK